VNVLRRNLVALAGLTAAAAVSRSAFALAQPTEKAPPILGPDPDTKTPKFRMPPLACDTHAHIFGPDDQYPFSPTRTYTPPEAPLSMFKALHDKLGIERCVVVNATLHGFDNRVVTDAIAQSNGRYKGVANVNDKMSDKELQALADAGIRACRFIFLKRLGGAGDMGVFQRLTQRAAALGWHIVIYLDQESVAEFTPILTKLPAPYVLDHMGTVHAARGGLEGANLKALLDLQQRDEKCWVKISGPERASATGAPWLDSAAIARKIIDNAPDRVIWGSDWPHPNLKVIPNDGDLVDLIPLYAPDEAVRQKLLVANPARLYRF
jgi:predicted TIM-barrel fold metal-dependent hydrolase